MATDTDKLMVLISAREKLAQGWCQRAQARKADSEATMPMDRDGVKHCLMGAVMYAAGVNSIPIGPKLIAVAQTPSEMLMMEVVTLLSSVLPDGLAYELNEPLYRVVHWNDWGDRRHEEVLDLLDRAIASLMKNKPVQEIITAADLEWAE